MPFSARLLTRAFYGSLVVVVVAVLLQLLPVVLPDGLATRIAHNSEGLVLALLLASWIQFARPRLAGAPRERFAIALVSAVLLVCGLLLLASELPSRFRTLNETFLAAALVVPWLQLRRPLPPRLALGVPAAVLLVVVAFNRTEPVTALAETLGVLLLVPLAFDLVDRGILDPAATTSTALRRTWYVLLVAAPVAFSVLEYRIGVSGLAGEVVRYLVRITEAFVCLLLVQLFFAVGLRRIGRPVDRSLGEPVAAAR